MHTVHVTSPSFPQVAENSPLDVKPGHLFQVLCGDADHWRAGIYSPAATEAAACTEFEAHSCPELFLLLSGRLTLVLLDADERRTVELAPERPLLVTAPHAGFCPDGPHTGRALVVERDSFCTAYGAGFADIGAAIRGDQNWK